jgi:hypothetical protein
MSTQEYCGRHSIHYAGYSCPRCDAEERHKELLNATEESVAETVDAMRESDYRRANPGDYACPHCKYISLKGGASRCPLCHGDVGSEYWNPIWARQRADAERKIAMEAAAAAERIRSAPEREAAAERAALMAANAAAEAQRRRRLRAGLILLSSGLAIGLLVAAAIRMNYVTTRPPAPDIVGVTPAQFTVDYWWCFEAEDQVRFEPSDMIYYNTPDMSSSSRNGFGTRGYPNSVNLFFGRRITVTAVDPNKRVSFRIWEQDRQERRPWFACGGR